MQQEAKAKRIRAEKTGCLIRNARKAGLPCEFTMKRHSYMPQRFFGGSFKENGLEIELRERKEMIPWENIQMICLGVIEEPTLKVEPTSYMRMKETVKKMFAKEKTKEEESKRKTIYLDFFITAQKEPYRAESSNLNYRELLEEAEHVSENNFRKFLKRLSEHLPVSAFDQSFTAFLANKKIDIEHYDNIYEFQRSCQEKWQRLRGEKE